MFTEVPAFLLCCIVPWRKLFLSEQKLQQIELDLKPETDHMQYT